MAKLAGLQDSFSATKRDSEKCEDALRRRIWLSTVCGDCYCSLLLGQQPVTGALPFGPAHEDWIDPVAEKEANVQRRICAVMADIAERNATGKFHSPEIALELGGRLDKIYESLPCTWWDTPSFAPNRSLESAQEPNRLLSQRWHFLARIFVDLPAAIGKSTKLSRDSLENCIDAARCTLSRHVALQYARDQLSRCRGGEQAAVLSAVALLLCVVQVRFQDARSATKQDKHRSALKFELDRDLIQQTIASFETQGKGSSREYMAMQCVDILSSMRDHAFGQDIFTPHTTRSFRRCDDEKSDMESLIATAIRPSLDDEGPGFRLLELTFGPGFG